MSERYNLVIPREGGGDKTWWQKVGTLWIGPDGKIKMKLDALPLGASNNGKPWDGWISVFPDEDKNDRPARNSNGGKPMGRVKTDLDDEIPF